MTRETAWYLSIWIILQLILPQRSTTFPQNYTGWKHRFPCGGRIQYTLEAYGSRRRKRMKTEKSNLLLSSPDADMAISTQHISSFARMTFTGKDREQILVSNEDRFSYYNAERPWRHIKASAKEFNTYSSIKYDTSWSENSVHQCRNEFLSKKPQPSPKSQIKDYREKLTPFIRTGEEKSASLNLEPRTYGDLPSS